MATPLTADQLLAAFDRWGVKYREHAGWRTHNRAGHGAWGPVHGIAIHHTGDDAPDSADERVLWAGRSDLPGPLCNWAQSDDGTTVLIGNGRANHFGNGSAATLRHVIAEDYTGNLTPGPDAVDGNARFYGQETMYSGGHAMTQAAYANTLRTFAAICDAHGWSARSIIGHKEWTRRKPDPGHVDMATLRRDVQQLLDAGPKGKPATKPTPVPAPTPKPGRAPVALDLAGKTITKLPSLTNARIALDKSWATIDWAKADADRRLVGVIGYLSADTSKQLGDAERARIHELGNWTWYVAEEGATAAERQKRALQGYDAGVADAKAADAMADRLGLPDHVVICHTVDTDANVADVLPYWRGIHDGARRDRGVYGGVRVLDGVCGAGYAKHGWQTTSWSQTGGALRISKWARLLQLHSTFRPAAAEIAGLDPKAYDPNLVLAGPAVPVWLPKQAKRTATTTPVPPAKPTTPPVVVTPPKDVKPRTTKVTVIERTRLAHSTSDHNGLVWDLRLSSGTEVRRGHWNVQGTDPAVATNRLVDAALKQADHWVFNEITTTAQQNYLLGRKGWGVYLPDAKLNATGDQVLKASAAAAIAIAWDESVWKPIATHSFKLVGGALHFTPTRVFNLVLLQHLVTGERVWAGGSQTPHHVDVDGKARIKGALLGQNGRAKTCYQGLATRTVEISAEKHDGLTAPVFASADLNVDYDRDRAHVLAGDGTSWFPYRTLGAVADVQRPNQGGPTHATRLIDQGWLRQAA